MSKKVALPKACMGFRHNSGVFDAPTAGGTVELPDSIAAQLARSPNAAHVGSIGGIGITFEALPDNYCLNPQCHFDNILWRMTCARCGSMTEHGAESCEAA